MRLRVNIFQNVDDFWESLASTRNDTVMITAPMSSFRKASSKKIDIEDDPAFKRVQGRPARGETEVGSQKIVEGMRAALRSLGRTNVTRKDIAEYTGVTPALVTYYFPERDTLIKAATLPVVETLVVDVKACFTESGSARRQLLEASKVLLECYARNAVIIKLFEEHKKTTSGDEIPDLLNDLETALTTFFEGWINNTASVYDADVLQKAMIGTCKSAADLLKAKSGRDPGQLGVAEMVCSMLLGSEFDAETAPAPNRTSVGGLI